MNNHAHAMQERKTVTVLFQQHPDYPEKRMGFVTPEAAECIAIMEELGEPERKDALRVIRAVQHGQFPYTVAEFTNWTPEQRSAAVALLPEYTA